MTWIALGHDPVAVIESRMIEANSVAREVNGETVREVSIADSF